MHRDLQSTFVPQVRNQLPQQLPETVTLLAVEGRIEITPDRRGVNLHLRGVEILVPEHISGTKSGKDSFIQKFSISESITIPLSFQSRQRKLKDLPNPRLNSQIDEIEKRIAIGSGEPGLERELRLALGERHRRNAFSLSGLTFPLLGAALCFMASFTSRLVPFFMSTIIVLVTFYPLLMVGTYLARSADIQPVLALAIPNAALLLVTAVFLQKVVRK